MALRMNEKHTNCYRFHSHDSAGRNSKEITGVTEQPSMQRKRTRRPFPSQNARRLIAWMSIPLIKWYLGYLQRERLIVKLVSRTKARMRCQREAGSRSFTEQARSRQFKPRA